jgi:hypothetical protein
MVEIKKGWILSQLQERLPHRSYFTGGVLLQRLGIPNDVKNEDFLYYYQQLYYCIKEGFIVFVNEWDNKRMKEDEDRGPAFESMYVNLLSGAPIRITGKGEKHLRDMTVEVHVSKMNSNVEDISNTGKVNLKSQTKVDYRNLIIAILALIIGAMGVYIAYLTYLKP